MRPGRSHDAARVAAAITLTYVIVGTLWIFFSGAVVLTLSHDPRILSRIEAFKGFAYVVATGAMLYAMIHRSVAERVRTNEALRESEARLRRIFTSDMVGMFFCEAGGRVTEANDAFLALVGYTARDMEAGRLDWQALTPPEFAERDAAAMAAIAHNGVCAPYEKQYVHRDGHRVDVLVGGASFDNTRDEGVCFVLDVTERKLLERQLLQAQKIDSLGRLAGGVAHDFNNLLTAILGYRELAEQELPMDHPAREHLARVGLAGQRAAELTRQLLVFSRRQAGEQRSIDLRSLLADLGRILPRLLGEQVQVSIAVPDGPLTVRADAGQITQVLINMAVNARDAMPDGGQLEILASGGGVDRSPAGEQVMVSVADTGVGMPPDVVEHIFEPFFTTKEPGSGTGLGLATSYAIVKQHGGHIAVASAVGKGTTFRVYLPAGGEQSAEPEAGARTGRPGGGDETILVVEDDPIVRAIAVVSLRASGYQVLEAGDGRAGLEQVACHDGPIDLVLTDMVLPQMDGREFARQMRLASPGVAVLYMSGYAYPTPPAGSEGGATPFLAKPFTPASLLERVRETLDSRQQPPA